MRSLALLSLSVLLFCVSCGDDDGVGPQADATVWNDAAADPCAPPADLPLPAFPADIETSTNNALRSMPVWHLIGNALTPGSDTLTVELRTPYDAHCFDAWVAGSYAGRYAITDTVQTHSFDLAGLAAGEHGLVLASTGSSDAFFQAQFVRTHPYYVLVGNDWDDALQEPDFRTREERLHTNHPAMKMTHFVGPYTFTDPALTTEQVDTAVAWLLDMRDTYDDEIGLHLHPYCNFVETTSVTCRWTPSLAYAEDPEGYTVVLGAYTLEETETLLSAGRALFEAHGLGTPTSFRAGGWAAEIHTLEALANTGFLTDTSACNWSRLEEWESAPGTTLYQWNQEHWATIDEYSQPYYPSEVDILAETPPVVPLLELPDNGLLVDYTTDEEIIEMFGMNWPGGALQAPTTFVTGYHPGSFQRYEAWLDAALTHIDGFLHANDDGPVIYETNSNMTLVWPVPE